MRLATQFQIYLAAIHLAVLGAAGWYYPELDGWFFVVELIVIVSWMLGARLIHRTLQPLAFVQSFSDLLHEQEFSARFSPVGQTEMDRLISLYNQMLSELYDERLRLGEQRGFLERFMQATPVGVIILDFDGRITLANAAARHFLGETGDSLAGVRLERLESELGRTMADLGSGESRLVTWRGSRRLRIDKQEFVDRGFRRRFVLIEELTRVLNESERAAYEKLIRLVSHEVNNTVASTNSLLQSCQTYAPQVSEADRADFLHALEVVITRNEHLNHFVRDFAQVVKLPPPDRRRCQLEDLLEHLRIIFRSQCEERNIVWSRSGVTPAPAVRLDREQFEQALLNVVKNAIEAIEADGSIEIAVLEQGNEVLLRVLDDGCGLSAGQRDQVFTPFYTSKAGGHGLGLTLVKEILLRHGFDFSLEAGSDGRTCFEICMSR